MTIREVSTPSARAMQGLLDLLPLAVLDLGPDGEAGFANQGWSALTGRPAGSALGTGWLEAFDPQEREAVRAVVTTGVAERRSVTADVLARTGLGRRVLRLDGRPELGPDGRVERFVLSVLDVTEERARHDRLAHAARHDPLTGLANRRAFLELARHRASAAVRAGRGYALVFLDVDDFKRVNDSGGHDVGDEVLQVVAERLCSAARPEDVVARFGGDEFVVLLDDVASLEHARSVAERMRQSIGEPLVVGGRRWRISGSLGVAMGHDDRVDDLLRRADDALYRAKASGKDRCATDDVETAAGVPEPRAAEPVLPMHGTHVVHFYDRDEELLDRVEDHVLEGLLRDGVAVVIATPEHRRALRERLEPRGLDGWSADGRYLEFDAAETLRRFMADGTPDPDLFQMAVGTVVRRATAGGRSLRAYGEMVGLLWAEGNSAAALLLEELWNDLQRSVDFPLLCAYPLADLDPRQGDGVAQICARHSHVLPLGA